jgi:Na+/H+ antiporter NhaD/arsenite permease-like protein
MLSLLCGVAAYTITFAFLLFCYRRFKARQNAKRETSAKGTPQRSIKANSEKLCFVLLFVMLALIATQKHPCSRAAHTASCDTERNYPCGISDVLQQA